MSYRKQEGSIRQEVEVRELTIKQIEDRSKIDYNIMMGNLADPEVEENEEDAE